MRSLILYSILVSTYCLSSCNGNNVVSKSEIKSLSTFKLSPTVDSLIGKYSSELIAPAYAIFIDKKSEGLSSYRITIAPFYKKVNDLYESGALNYFILNDSTPVFLYSGLEDFVVCDSPSFAKMKEKPSEISNGEFKYWEPIKRMVDFSRSWSYIYSDTLSPTSKGKVSPYIVKGDSNPFSVLTVMPPQVVFE